MNGALYENGTPLDAQTAFQLIYSRHIAYPALALEILGWFGYLVVAAFLFVLPGWGVLGSLWPGWSHLTWPTKLALSVGLSLCFYPILFLWTDLIGIHLGALYAWLPPVAGLILILLRNRTAFRRSNLKRLRFPSLKPRNFLSVLPYLVLILILMLIVFTRFWAVRGIAAPMGIDTLHHTIIAQLLVDHGGLFTSWKPYADMNTFTYHFGFHTEVAVFDWLTRLEMTQAVLWVGQIMNILAIIALFPLAEKVGRSPWAGVATVLIAGLLSPMPMYYTNWGRYPQLAGQVILPVLAWLLWELYENKSSSPVMNWGMIAVSSLAMGGLALTHYRIFILALIFLVVLCILTIRRATWRSIMVRTIWIGSIGGLLFLPWFLRLLGGNILNILSYQLSTPAAEAMIADPQRSSDNISFYLPYLLWIGTAVAVAIGLWRREKGTAIVGLWWLGNLLAANPYWLGLPGAGAISRYTIIMAMYIPAAVLVGAVVGWMDGILVSRPRLFGFVFYGIAVIFLGIGLLGVGQRRKDIQPLLSFLTYPDIRAMDWLQENTSPEDGFLVSAYFILSNTTMAGTDGGYWLTYLTHRQDEVPPLAYGFEREPWPGYISSRQNLLRDIQVKGLEDPNVISQLRNQAISYVYIGQMQGYFGGRSFFQISQLLSNPNFVPVYHWDRVWIFKLNEKSLGD